MSKSVDRQKAALLALQESLSWSTVGIVADYQGHEGQGIGTGTAIRYAGRKMILTAEHVIKDTPTERLYFFFRPEGNLNYAEFGEIRDIRGIATSLLKLRERISIARIVFSQEYDLAAILVDGDPDQKHSVRFFDVKDDSVTPPADTVALIKGYPADTTRQMERSDDFAMFPSMEMTAILPSPDSLDDFDPALHFVMPCSIAQVEGRSPRGFSGGGVWYQGAVLPLSTVGTTDVNL